MAKKIDPELQKSFPKINHAVERKQYKEFHFDDGSHVFGTYNKKGSLINSSHISADGISEYCYDFFYDPGQNVSRVETYIENNEDVFRKVFNLKKNEIDYYFIFKEGKKTITVPGKSVERVAAMVNEKKF